MNWLRSVILFLIFSGASCQMVAQTEYADSNKTCPWVVKLKNVWEQTKEWCLRNEIATSLDGGISIGSMGIGLEISTPVTKWTKIRAGVDWLPEFKAPMSFNLNTYAHGLPTGNFNNVANMVYDMTGIEIDERVYVNGYASMVNFKFLVDVFPFQSNRHWHFTAGFYAGSSKIARAINVYDEKPTLVGLNIYNRGYEYFSHLESIYDVPLGGGTYMNPLIVEKLIDRFNRYGRMGIHVGDFKDGTPYIMEPAPDGTVSANAFVNHFKPFLGAGFSTNLDNEKKWNIGVDVGMIFWGGAPDVYNYDYVTGRNINFTTELKDIRGKVGHYMNIIKTFKVYPVLEISVSYNIL